MADASRFPSLVVPFAIVGAAAGWLSVGLVQHAVMVPTPVELRAAGATFAALLGGATGGLLTLWCAGKRYGYESEAPDPTARLATDRWPRHVAAVLGAGVLTGALVGALPRAVGPLTGAYFGFLCALPFLPVCAAVLAAARRAQRARLGSIVAASDRRAVWGILATLLAAATLESAPDWSAPRASDLGGPLPAVGLLVASTACILVCLLLDALALRRATHAVAPGLAPREQALSEVHDRAPRVDLGLGAEVHARLVRAAAAYRGRDRTLGIVEGDAGQALAALRRAIRRGALGLAVAFAVVFCHLAADSVAAHALYEERRCALGRGEACGNVVAYAERSGDPGAPDPRARAGLYERGCDFGDGPSCLSLAGMYRGQAGLEADFLLVAHYEYLAAQRGFCPPRTELVWGRERVCVTPGDPRARSAALAR